MMNDKRIKAQILGETIELETQPGLFSRSMSITERWRC